MVTCFWRQHLLVIGQYLLSLAFVAPYCSGGHCPQFVPRDAIMGGLTTCYMNLVYTDVIILKRPRFAEIVLSKYILFIQHCFRQESVTKCFTGIIKIYYTETT